MVRKTLFSIIILLSLTLCLLWYIRYNYEGFADMPLADPTNTIPASTAPTGSPSQIDLNTANNSTQPPVASPVISSGAQLPVASANPIDVPGSTTVNPTQSIPQPKDIQATIDSLNAFQSSYLKTSPDDLAKQSLDTQAKMKAVIDAYPVTIKMLTDALNNIPGAFPYTLAQLSENRRTYDQLTQAFASPVSSTPPRPTVVAFPPGKLSLMDLLKLRDRIQSEIERIKSLRSSSPTLLAKQSQLEKIGADLLEMISKIKRRQMSIMDVPINPSDANSFLQSLQNDVVSSTLITPKGTAKTHPNVSFANDMMPKTQTNNNLQSLLENAKYLKWNVQVNMEFNPELAQKDRYIQRLETIENRLTNLAMSETPVPKEVYEMYMKELKIIRDIVTDTKFQDKPPNLHIRKPNHKYNISTPDVPSSLQLDRAQSLASDSSSSIDTKIRTRASNASFDPSKVGTLDYKERAKNLCAQIGGAQLGDPTEFGCIMDQSSVSKNYSWKGNVEMICSRLGNTWGAWYPEMFGCPKKA